MRRRISCSVQIRSDNKAIELSGSMVLSAIGIGEKVCADFELIVCLKWSQIFEEIPLNQMNMYQPICWCISHSTLQYHSRPKPSDQPVCVPPFYLALVPLLLAYEPEKLLPLIQIPRLLKALKTMKLPLWTQTHMIHN